MISKKSFRKINRIPLLALIITTACSIHGAPPQTSLKQVPETQKSKKWISLILKNPCSGKPLPHVAYRMLSQDKDAVIVNGFTNKKGETASIYVQEPVSPYYVQEVVGKGECGRSFFLRYEDSDTPVKQQKYQIKLKDKVVAKGFSDNDGNTKYILGGKCGETLEIEVLNKSCRQKIH